MSKNTLLGKKRESRETEGDEVDEFIKTKEEKNLDLKENNEKKEEKAGEESKKSSLFGDLGKAPQGGLFGKLFDGENKEDQPKLFSNTGSSNLFANSSLFSNTNKSIFSGESSSLFGNKSLFNFNTLAPGKSFLDEKKTKEDDSEGEEGDDNDVFQSNSPNSFNPLEKTTPVGETSLYTKKFNKEIENIFVYSKEEAKFLSKGKGYLSIEFADVNGKKVGVVVFR